ncbi:MAG: glycosyltransferase family 4 protein [Acidobacteria bacterium]|nr:glycosyltransferase family 4 protein [Acidobacteriota bacterium]
MKTNTTPRVIACCGGMVIVAGLERMTFEVLRTLRQRGAAVHCIVNNWENHRIVALADQIGASWSTGYYQVGFGRQLFNPLHLARFLWDVAMTSLGLLRDARRFRPTHVLLPDFVTVLKNAPALVVLRWLGVKAVLRLGNAPEAGRLYQLVWRWAVSPTVDRFVCNSRFTTQELLAHGVPAAKVSYIYNTVPYRQPSDNAANESQREPNKVIYVGQIIPPKGLDLLIEAIAILVNRDFDVRLDVVGNIGGWESPTYTGYRQNLLDRAAQPDLVGRVRFLGWREDVPALLAQAGVHCCPSIPELREGFGLVNIEAKQAGIPSVVFPTGALPELIAHRVDGWVCSEVTAAALAEGIEYFLSDSARREQAGQLARHSVERFSPERFADGWWAIFKPVKEGEVMLRCLSGSSEK